VAAPLPKVNPWKKPEPVVAVPILSAAQAEERAAAEKNNSIKPVKKAENKTPNVSAVVKAKKEEGVKSAAADACSHKEDEKMATVAEEDNGQKKVEIRTLPPAPKTNPWKKSVAPEGKEESDQPKVTIFNSIVDYVQDTSVPDPLGSVVGLPGPL
jgi:hypothetical protein